MKVNHLAAFPAFLLLLLIPNPALCQNYQADFASACADGDTSRQIRILNSWESADPTNAELFTAWFNYYFLKAQREMLSITTSEPNGENLAFQDSTGATVGFIGSMIAYNDTIVEEGLTKIDQGIKLYPDRLDMRFGKIYALGQIQDWSRFTMEIVNTIQYSTQNENNWTWTNNEKKAGGKEFFLSALQDYQLQLYNTGDDSLLRNMQSIANEVLKFYPDHVESLSNLSITYLLANDFDSAIDVLLKAERLAPQDPVILGNIAEAYKRRGDTKKAITYFKKNYEVRRCSRRRVYKTTDRRTGKEKEIAIDILM